MLSHARLQHKEQADSNDIVNFFFAQHHTEENDVDCMNAIECLERRRLQAEQIGVQVDLRHGAHLQ